MKKLLKVAIILFVIIIFIFGLTLFSKKGHKIKIIENIRQTIRNQLEEVSNKSDEANSNITIFDITGLVAGKAFEHDCQLYLISNYNETNHWNECRLCYKKYDIEAHNLIDNGWTLGNENNCHDDNVHKFSCNCGYNTENSIGKKNHLSRYIQDLNSYSGYNYCDACKTARNDHKCYNSSNGKRITCNNLGTCSICGYTYTYINGQCGTYDKDDEKCNSEDLYCDCGCNTYVGHVNYNYIEKISNNVYKYYTSITMLDGANYSKFDIVSDFGSAVSITSSPSINGTTWSNVVTITFNNYVEKKGKIAVAYIGNRYGRAIYHWTRSDNIKLDEEPPIIENINQEINDNWERTKEIIISGIENYCSTVNIELLDEKENVVFEGTAPVTSNNWTIKATPEIEADEEGKKFTVIVTDSLENISSKDFIISKVDVIAPEITSEDTITGDWAKERKFTFTSIDTGSGNVQIAFNDMNDFKLATKDGNNYSREYSFVGDAYKPIKAIALFKDELGNTSSQEVTIDKIDNTVPTITAVKVEENKLVITSNDIKEGIGEGSGVIKYRYMTSAHRLQNPEFTAENSNEVNKDDEIIISNENNIDFIYVVAEDLVGNVSDVYELRLQDLVLSSKVNLDLADGKGGVELDWKDYDTTDTYFVIYRKEENQTEWEKIVDLNDKLSANSYIDILGNDKVKPIAPTIDVGTTLSEIQINFASEDNGTTYTYYVEAYDVRTNILMKTSNTQSVKM